jgi:N-acetylglucosamine-6-phosphate deacetylase
MDGDTAAVRTALRAHLRHGTTTMFPTTTTGSPEQISAMLHACRTVRDEGGANLPHLAGVHFYGPYFAENKVGAHKLSGRRDPDPSEYLKAFALGIVRIATCAAELPGCERFYREAARRKYLITCGHSQASWTEMARGFKAGLRHVDHFWSAMSTVTDMRQRFGTPMQGAMEQFVLAEPGMSTEVIADGEHLCAELLEFAYRMKGVKRLCLVSDCNRALDMPPGDYRIGPKKDGGWFTSNGKAAYQPGSKLAGSIMGMDQMVRRMHAMTRVPLYDVVRMATLTPAERTGIAAQAGSLEPGKRADILILNRQLAVKRVFVSGVEADISARYVTRCITA